MVCFNKKAKGNLTNESQNYLKNLGIKPGAIFTIKQGTIFLKDKNISEKFSLKERKILTLFINKKNELCSLDEIAKTIWEQESETKFSPWAIAKAIQRLRDKIESLGVTSTVIQAKRKEGYLLID